MSEDAGIEPGTVATLDALSTRLDLIQNYTLSDWFRIPGLTTAREDVIDTLVVETAYGNVRGFSKLVLGTKLYVFYGIPYAKPPIGKRRWELEDNLNSAAVQWVFL